MAKKNVKEWLKEHKNGIRYCAVAGAGALIGGAFYATAYRFLHRDDFIVGNNAIKIMLKDADRCAMPGYAFGWKSDPIEPEQLGELGRQIVTASQYVPGQKFTHFIAIGKDIKTK